jgi:penicillin amidase
VEILRDALGVPHCYADDEAGAFHAQGWVHAADRLWQMEYDRRRAVGRLAEIVGVAAVAADVFYRRMDLESSVRRDVAALAPSTIAMLESYAAGVNAWLASEPLPREFEVAGLSPADVAPWEPWHSLVVYRVRHLLMGSARTKLWRSVVAGVLGADVARSMVAGWGEEQIACVPPGAVAPKGVRSGLGDVDGGSNNWVVSGARTASGLPLLAGDPHRELEAPNVYVQGHVACPEWDVLGIGMPGVPGFPHFGHNERVAWSITHAMADDQDLFAFEPGAFPVSRTEVVSVRGGDRVEVDVVHTPRGPIVGEGLALFWTAAAPGSGPEDANCGFDAFVPMLRAASVGELFETMRPWVEPVNSLLAADVEGAIGYQLRGRLPVRRRDDAVWLPVAGDDDSFAWDGWVPFESLPCATDPEGGFLFSANNRIAAAEDAPYVGLDAAAPWRARRIVSLLSSLEEATVEDMVRVHLDDISLPARRVRERLGTWPPLAAWDGSMSSLSTPAAAYSVLRRELLLVALERSGLSEVLTHPRNRLLPGVVPESVLWRVVEQHLQDDDTSLLGGWSWDEAIAVARLRADDVWRGESWGALHRSSQRHVLGGLDPTLHPLRRVELSGDLDTVFASGYTPTAGFDVKAGSVARCAFDLADWDRSGWVVPLGAAGAGPSPHVDDQQDAWASGRLFPAPYSRAAVEASAESAAAGG